MNLTVKIGDKQNKLKLPEKLIAGQMFQAELNGQPLRLLWQAETRTLVMIQADGTERSLLVRASTVLPADGGESAVDGEYGIAFEPHSFAMHDFKALVDYDIPGQGHRAAAKGTKGLVLRSQITGKVLKILVKPGDTVQAGDSLLIIEAMKMENRIFASQGGRIGSVAVNEGDSVATGRELLRIEST